MTNLVFLVSGNGGNLKFVYEYISKNKIQDVEIHCIADRECGAIDFARKVGIKSKVINYERSSPANLTQYLQLIGSDIIVTNWHKIIDANTVTMFSGKMINLHYSLLPSFGGVIGVKPIELAFEKKCKFIGVTCHYVDEGVDTGEIIAQATFSSDLIFADAVDTAFRAGAVILMDSILQASNISCMLDEKTNQMGTINFSPEIQLDLSTLDDEFWEKLK